MNQLPHGAFSPMSEPLQTNKHAPNPQSLTGNQPSEQLNGARCHAASLSSEHLDDTQRHPGNLHMEQLGNALLHTASRPSYSLRQVDAQTQAANTQKDVFNAAIRSSKLFGVVKNNTAKDFMPNPPTKVVPFWPSAPVPKNRKKLPWLSVFVALIFNTLIMQVKAGDCQNSFIQSIFQADESCCEQPEIVCNDEGRIISMYVPIP